MMGLPGGVDPIVFYDLKEKYEAKEVVVFAGAGVSAGAGLPSWKRLAELLIERMRQMRKSPDAIDEVAELIHKGDLVTAMSAARASLRNEFDHLLKSKLDDTGRNIPEVANAIARLAPRLSGVVTTNLDRFLERAFGGAWPPIVEPVSNLAQRAAYIFKPHGTIDNPNTWVFTREEYDQAMFGSQQLQDVFWALYAARTLLFVGASLTDDDFGLTLGRVRAQAGRNPPTHYAILPEPIRPTRRDQLERAGIRLLAYENTSGTHHEVVEILHALVPSSGSSMPPPGSSPGQKPLRVQTNASASPPSPHSLPLHDSSPPPRATSPTPSVAATMKRPVDIYISASPNDAALRKRLLDQLSALERDGTLRVTHEGLIRPGEERKKVLTGFFDNARILLVLLSADYLASDEQHAELQAALARSRAGTATLIPVLLKPAIWQPAFTGHDLKPVPDKAITRFTNTDDGFVEVVEAVMTYLPKT